MFILFNVKFHPRLTLVDEIGKEIFNLDKNARLTTDMTENILIHSSFPTFLKFLIDLLVSLYINLC
jgi:hypothetical protein